MNKSVKVVESDANGPFGQVQISQVTLTFNLFQNNFLIVALCRGRKENVFDNQILGELLANY